MVERARTKWEEANPSIRRTRDPLPRPGASPGVRQGSAQAEDRRGRGGATATDAAAVLGEPVGAGR